MNKNKVEIELGLLKNSCFVVMPFQDLFQTEYEKVIYPAINELGIEVVRADGIYSNQRIMDDIWKSLRQCRFVLAELTGRNPNVLYEVGLAHAIGKPVVIITRNEDDVPFDLKDLRYLYYSTDDPMWGENLKKGIQALLANMLGSNDFGDYLKGIKLIGELTYPKIVKEEVVTIAHDYSEIIDISGNWKGQFLMNGIRHEVLLHIAQNGTDLTGTATISFINLSALTVVQEIFSGSIAYKEIEISGVNYTLIERGSLARYNLDTFKLKYNENEYILTGLVLDEKAKEGSAQVVFNKL